VTECLKARIADSIRKRHFLGNGKKLSIVTTRQTVALVATANRLHSERMDIRHEMLERPKMQHWDEGPRPKAATTRQRANK
jgi:hypothetical protein